MLSLTALPLLFVALVAQMPIEPFPLWTGQAPGALGTDPVKDVPTLTPYWPLAGKATGAAMVVCPGGGYAGLADHEGRDYGLWLAEHGVAAFVLKYRLGSNGYHHPVEMYDVQRALRTVRYHATDWKIDARRVGVMGSSAGGHLAATAATHYDDGKPDASDPIDRVGCRPDLAILCYPVITMGAYTHAGSKLNLLGASPSPDLVALMSNELQVTKDTPPCFLWHTRDDDVVPIQNSLAFASALAKAGVPYDLHVYQHGPHGMGLGLAGYQPGKTDPSKLLPWTYDLAYWLRLQKFLP